MVKLLFCRVIKDDGARLKCFDEAIAQFGAPQTSEGPTKPSATAERPWRFDDSKSPIDDSPQVAAILADADGKGILLFRCREKKIDGGVLPDGYINIAADRIKGMYRLGEAKPVEVQWNGSTGGRGAFFNNAAGFLNQLTDDTTLFIRIHDYRGVPHDASFSLGKISEVKERVLGACAGIAKPKPRQ